MYQSHWALFRSWCLQRNADFFSPSVPLVAEFLLYLFEDKSYAPATIKGYRAAIVATLDSPYSEQIGHSVELSRLVQNFSLNRPRVRSLVPQWNLSLVLDLLLHSPFEPLHSAEIRFLTWKTVFLISFASARRRSEIHALSSDPACLRFSPNYTQVSLRTDPTFLAKNQLSSFSGADITIPALTPFVGRREPDRLLCPVRALRFYLDRTNSYRGNRRRLFLPLRPGTPDISKDTISRWLTQVIKLAYQNDPVHRLTLHRIRPHEIRAIASSWALAHHVPLSAIMDAAYWRSHSTFSSFYLRSLCNESDGIHTFGPLVAAQSVIRPPSSA